MVLPQITKKEQLCFNTTIKFDRLDNLVNTKGRYGGKYEGSMKDTANDTKNV